MKDTIDVRSDTVTRPCTQMHRAMMEATVGDDVYGDDPSVNRLQMVAAELLGHEAALFMPTGTQSNLVALLTHCQRGDEYIVGADAHTFKYEGGGAAALGGIQPQTIAPDESGGLSLDAVAAVIKEDDVHFARSVLLCLENTQHGRVQSLESMQDARAFTRRQGLQLHLDGARMANAAVYLNVELKQIAQCFDSVSLCLSKGLGAPMGSILVGSEAFIHQARRWRKMTGGGLRQSGFMAAAGLYALTQNVARLQQDHDNAAFLTDQLEHLEGVSVRQSWTQTNMVWLDLAQDVGDRLQEFAKNRGVLLSARGRSCRIVIHLDVTPQHIEKLVLVLSEFFNDRV